MQSFRRGAFLFVVLAGTLIDSSGVAAQSVFTVDPARSGVRIRAVLSTPLGSPSAADSSAVSGHLSAHLSSQGAFVTELQVTEVDVMNVSPLRLTFSFGLFGSLRADVDPEDLRLFLEEPGPPSPVAEGAFTQPENRFVLDATLHLSNTQDPQELRIPLTADLSGTVAQGGGSNELVLPISLSGETDVSGNRLQVTITGSVRASSPVATYAELPDVYESGFVLEEPYPSPTADAATIQLSTEHAHTIRIDVYDVRGRQVAQLFDGLLAPGRHAFRFDADGLPAGVYFVTAAGDHGRSMAKVVVIR